MRLSTFLAFKISLWALASMQMVTQPKAELVKNEGDSVNLTCTYRTGYPTLMWYLQDTSKSITFILDDQSSPEDLQPKFRQRFSVSIFRRRQTFVLTISPVTVEDSSTYYCAVRHVGVTYTNSMVFGSGTKLTVEPGKKPPTAPQVFELKTKGENSSTACLAKDFYPKDIEISVNKIKQENITTILSKNGLYSAVSVHNVKSDVFGCEVKQILDKTNIFEGIKKSSEEEASADNQCRRTDGAEVQSTALINMLSLTILGMWALFAKTLAFNLILSAKIFIM